MPSALSEMAGTRDQIWSGRRERGALWMKAVWFCDIDVHGYGLKRGFTVIFRKENIHKILILI